ncbi:MAG: hypothetical protein FD168_1987 [Desulfobulbaceae bacterium]|jgi:hypothetical protein|nr:MAG: hypothetical protein FD168_1987 [Desulfobulbaceae bacterium]
MENTAITKSPAKATAHESAGTDSELYKVGTVITAVFAASIGVWSLVCLCSALMTNGGPITLVKSMFSAITGI